MPNPSVSPIIIIIIIIIIMIIDYNLGDDSTIWLLHDLHVNHKNNVKKSLT